MKMYENSSIMLPITVRGESRAKKTTGLSINHIPADEKKQITQDHITTDVNSRKEERLKTSCIFDDSEGAKRECPN